MPEFTQKDIDEVIWRVAFTEALRKSAMRRRSLMRARSALNQLGQYPATYTTAVFTAKHAGYKPNERDWVNALSRLMKCTPDVIRQHVAAMDEERTLNALSLDVDDILVEYQIEIPSADFDDHMPE